MPPAIFQIVLIATVVANVAFILGLRFALTGPLFAGLLLLVLSYRNSWSMIYHSDNLVVLHVLILGLARSADVLSLDSLWRGPLLRQGPHLVVRPPGIAGARHWEYGYPIRLLCAVTVAVYVLSATAKLAGQLGLNWALGDGLRYQVGFDALRKELLEGGAQPLAYVVFNSLPLATALGIGTIIVELGAVAALFDERIGRLWAVAAYAMHWGIYAVMGITFWYQLTGLAFVPFLLSEGLIRWGRDEAVRWVGALARTPPCPRIATRRADETDAGNAPIHR
jgi:hypothetical protein